jgi:hypothetical protein
MQASEIILSPEAVNAIARQITLAMQQRNMETPLYVSQSRAFGRYGRARVERWICSGKVRINASGGKNDLRFEDLERCAITEEYVHGVMKKRNYNKKQI